MEHVHVNKGMPYDHNAPIDCDACKVWLREKLIENYLYFCDKYGTEPDLRNITDMLVKYEVKE